MTFHESNDYDYSQLIKKYDAVPLDETKLSSYVRGALRFFHDQRFITNPNLEMTLQLDITEAEQHYHQNFSKVSGATFTGYLYWHIIQAIKEHPCFAYREINGVWYHFRNLPLFFPIAIGGHERFYDAFIENVCQMNWQEFAVKYSEHIEFSRKHKPSYKSVRFHDWNICIVIGNLSNLRFTSLHLHQSLNNMGKPIFYFGQRHEINSRKHVPFYVMMDHANLDPYVLGNFIESFSKNASTLRPEK